MPQIGNLSAKKFDGTTAVTLTAIQPSAGDQPAVWRDNSTGSAPRFRPELTYSVKTSGDRRSKRGYLKFRVPQLSTNTTTGVVSVVNEALFEIRTVIPVEMPESAVKDAAAILASALLPAAGTLCQAVAEGSGVV